MTDPVQKVFMNKDNKANFTCPVCSKARLMDVSQYKDIDKAVKVKAKCPCGHVYSVLLERRRHVRKAVSLIGSYTADEKGMDIKGRMTVVDISRTGLRFKMHMQHYFEENDQLSIEFHLDDQEQTLVKRKVIVRSIHGLYVGVRFASDQHYDKLGTYLLYQVG
ncbi:MAG: PilZ domain-containing protein [Thermodesulfobacteriota bacterium]